MKLKEEVFQYWEYVWHSRTVRIATQGTISKIMQKKNLPKKPNIEILQLEIQSVVMDND